MPSSLRHTNRSPCLQRSTKSAPRSHDLSETAKCPPTEESGRAKTEGKGQWYRLMCRLVPDEGGGECGGVAGGPALRRGSGVHFVIEVQVRDRALLMLCYRRAARRCHGG